MLRMPLPNDSKLARVLNAVHAWESAGKDTENHRSIIRVNITSPPGTRMFVIRWPSLIEYMRDRVSRSGV